MKVTFKSMRWYGKGFGQGCYITTRGSDLNTVLNEIEFAHSVGHNQVFVFVNDLSIIGGIKEYVEFLNAEDIIETCI